ncbi:MAG: TetR/AcrR family transcriptional regulator [Clostridia bacterium]
MEHDSSVDIRERLIIAGIQELEMVGVQNLSLRRVASACSLSSGAPYKHFVDKDAFILAIVDYLRKLWFEKQDQIIERFPNNPRAQIIEICIAHCDMFIKYPYLLDLKLFRYESAGRQNYCKVPELSAMACEKLEEYFRIAGIEQDDEVRRIRFAVRSIVTGTAMMLRCGDFPDNTASRQHIRKLIEHEFPNINM